MQNNSFIKIAQGLWIFRCFLLFIPNILKSLNLRPKKSINSLLNCIFYWNLFIFDIQSPVIILNLVFLFSFFVFHICKKGNVIQNIKYFNHQSHDGSLLKSQKILYFVWMNTLSKNRISIPFFLAFRNCFWICCYKI